MKRVFTAISARYPLMLKSAVAACNKHVWCRNQQTRFNAIVNLSNRSPCSANTKCDLNISLSINVKIERRMFLWEKLAALGRWVEILDWGRVSAGWLMLNWNDKHPIWESNNFCTFMYLIWFGASNAENVKRNIF